MGGDRAGGTVIGIVGDVRDYGPAARVPPTLYLAHAQWPVGAMTIVAKARNGDPSSLVQPMRALLQDLDPRRADVGGALDGADCRRPRSRSRACIWC